MGKFLTALHVKTTGKEQFIEKFTQLMKKDGYVPCSEDEAAVSYAAAFSEDGWVTLSNGESTTTELSKTAKKIAEEMDTLCFTAEVVDSDFAILNLCAHWVWRTLLSRTRCTISVIFSGLHRLL